MNHILPSSWIAHGICFSVDTWIVEVIEAVENVPKTLCDFSSTVLFLPSKTWPVKGLPCYRMTVMMTSQAL